MAMDEETRKLLEEAMKHADPEMIAKFGNPLDANDPRSWTPSKRIEEGVSLEDQVKYLGLDLEAQTVLFSRIMNDISRLQEQTFELMKSQLLEQMKNDPEGAVKKLMELAGLGHDTPTGSYGPLENDPNSPVRYAGSTEGIAPDQMVDTPQGMIRADQIPGYVNDPKWKPSPDWVDANCMCPEHVRQREGNQNPFDGPTGMYL